MKSRKPKTAKPKKPSKAEAAAQQLAELLEIVPETPDCPVPPPRFLTGALLAGAVRVWKDVTPHLDRLNLLSETDKYLLAAFCVYVAEYVAANEEVLVKGYSVDVKTISGDMMPRVNPAVARRDDAFKYMLELSKNFGFTTRHLHELIGLQNRSGYGPLFGDRKPAQTAPAEAAEDEQVPASDPEAEHWQRLLNEPTPEKPN